MDRASVNSSNIRSIGYHEPTRTLHVEFKNQKVFEYSGVSPEAHRELVNAPSVGSHFAAQIRGSHQGKKV